MLWFEAPIQIGADEARRLAVTELLDPVYAQARPPWWQRAAEWVIARLGDVLREITGAGAAVGWRLVLVALVVLLVVVVLRRTGGLRAEARADRTVFVGADRSAAEHRLLAEEAATAREWSTAVLESFRAAVRTLEERGLLDVRAGRTADEVAAAVADRPSRTTRDAAAASPVDAGEIFRSAARTFDQIVYGGWPADAHAYEVVHRADLLAGQLRLTPAPSPVLAKPS